MPSRPTLLALTLLLAATLPAQTPPYRLALSDGENGGHPIITNNSNRTIEAFHLSSECGMNSGGSFTRDILNGNNSFPFELLEGRARPSLGGIHPWARMTFGDTLPPQPSHCAYQARVDAVLYADGNYAGDRAFAEGLQAYRDGMADSLRYWLNLLKGLPHGPSDLPAILAEAERLKASDIQKAFNFTQCHQDPVVCEYWQGRMLIDVNVPHWGQRPTATPVEDYDNLRRALIKRKSQIDANQAFKILETSLPLPLALQNLVPDTPTAAQIQPTQTPIAPQSAPANH